MGLKLFLLYCVFSAIVLDRNEEWKWTFFTDDLKDTRKEHPIIFPVLWVLETIFLFFVMLFHPIFHATMYVIDLIKGDRGK